MAVRYQAMGVSLAYRRSNREIDNRYKYLYSFVLLNEVRKLYMIVGSCGTFIF